VTGSREARYRQCGAYADSEAWDRLHAEWCCRSGRKSRGVTAAVMGPRLWGELDRHPVGSEVSSDVDGDSPRRTTTNPLGAWPRSRARIEEWGLASDRRRTSRDRPARAEPTDGLIRG